MTYYCRKTNTLMVSPFSGVKIRDIFNHTHEKKGEHFNHTGHKWIEGSLCLTSERKMYEVFFSFNHSDYETIIRVKKKYFEAEFEDFFGLGMQCSDWSPNTIVGIINNNKPAHKT